MMLESIKITGFRPLARLEFRFNCIQQSIGNSFYYRCIAAIGTNTRGNIVDYISQFAAFKDDNGTAIDGLRLPADQAVHCLRLLKSLFHFPESGM